MRDEIIFWETLDFYKFIMNVGSTLQTMFQSALIRENYEIMRENSLIYTIDYSYSL